MGPGPHLVQHLGQRREESWWPLCAGHTAHGLMGSVLEKTVSVETYKNEMFSAEANRKVKSLEVLLWKS